MSAPIIIVAADAITATVMGVPLITGRLPKSESVDKIRRLLIKSAAKMAKQVIVAWPLARMSALSAGGRSVALIVNSLF